jgi:hypothetical protein
MIVKRAKPKIMSELNFNGFFDALKKDRDNKEAIRIIEQDKIDENLWWDNYENQASKELLTFDSLKKNNI